MQLASTFEKARMESVDAYIGVRGAANSSQFADVPQEQMDLYQKHWWHPVHIDVRVPKTRWVVLRYPTDSFAQAARMSTAAFEDFYFDVCTADYAAMQKAQRPLVERMEAADHVRITAPWYGTGILDQRHSRDPLLWSPQYSGRRSLYGARPGEHQRVDPVQHPIELPGDRLR